MDSSHGGPEIAWSNQDCSPMRVVSDSRRGYREDKNGCGEVLRLYADDRSLKPQIAHILFSTGWRFHSKSLHSGPARQT